MAFLKSDTWLDLVKHLAVIVAVSLLLLFLFFFV